MSALLEISGLVKEHGALRPLRIRELKVSPTTVMSIAGIDALGAEVFVYLLTGATLPEEGVVKLFGQDTRGITDSAEWLKSLDGIGMITSRGILIEAFSILQNIAMSYTLDVDPIDPRVVPQAGALAREVGIASELFDLPAGKAGPDVKMRVHLARALALEPKLLIGRTSVGGAAAGRRRCFWRRPRPRRTGASSRPDGHHRRRSARESDRRPAS